jgi:hypothetical protein
MSLGRFGKPLRNVGDERYFGIRYKYERMRGWLRRRGKYGLICPYLRICSKHFYSAVTAAYLSFADVMDMATKGLG